MLKCDSSWSTLIGGLFYCRWADSSNLHWCLTDCHHGNRSICPHVHRYRSLADDMLYFNYSWANIVIHLNWISLVSIWQSWLVWGFAGSVWESCTCYHGSQHHLSSSSVRRLSYLQRSSDRRPSLARPDFWTHCSGHMGVVHRPGEFKIL